MSVTYLEPFGVNTSANYTFANVLVTANITNNGNVNFNGASNVNLGSNANLHITGGSSGAVLSTDGSGGLTWTSSGSVGVAGSNTQIQFNDNNSFGANANLTFNKTTKTLTVDNITANGAGLTYTTGGNVNGQVGNALIAGTVYTNAQPNITSVGSLNSLTVTGLITATGTGLKAANIQDSSGTITITTKYNSVSGDVGIYGNLNVGTSGTGFFIGDGGYISNVKSSNITGQVANALVAGTVYTNAQPNITSVGTLTSLGVTGTTTSGNFATAGNITASFLVSNVATGTAPFTVTSTTRVSNLNVAYANVSDFNVITTQTTGTFYPVFVNGSTTANYALGSNSNISVNLATGTFFSNNSNITNNLNTKYLNISSISQELFSTIASATGIVVHNVSNGPTFYHTTPSANFTPNFTNVTITANTTTVVSLIIVQGVTPYMPTATANIQIEGANNTINWINGSAPIGSASKIDVVNFSLLRGASSWTILGQSATFG